MAENDPQKNRTLMWILIGIIVVLIIIIVVVFVNRSEGESLEEETIKSIAEESSLTIGSTVKRDEVSITLESVQEEADFEGNQASDNKIFIITNWTVENQSAEFVSIAADQFRASYNETEIASLTDLDNFEQTDLGSGESYTGRLAYEVPKDFTQMAVVVAPAFWNQDATFSFNLNDIASQEALQ